MISTRRYHPFLSRAARIELRSKSLITSVPDWGSMKKAATLSLVFAALLVMGCTTPSGLPGQNPSTPVPAITTPGQIPPTPSPLPVITTGPPYPVANTSIAGTYRSAGNADNYYTEVGIVSGSLAYSSNCPGAGSICRKVQLSLEFTSPGEYLWKSRCCDGSLHFLNATHLQVITTGSTTPQDLYRMPAL
jgi:hypothetical protein